jgi:MarR family transcriptional regulator, organic hydroperoxide resistance regulator
MNMASPEGQVSDQALETSRLLVEFLHAAYATRNLDTEAESDAAIASPTGRVQEGTHAKTSVDVSTHAVRAAIHVHQHGERTVGQLASGMGISYGWASRVVDELEAAGYLIRARDTSDRRIVRVRLNPAMRTEVERAYRWRGHAVEQALQPLKESEREAVRTFLRRITEQLLANQA